MNKTPPPVDEWNDQTVVDGETITPLEVPRCVECGAVAFDDEYTDAALAIGVSRCVRSKPGHPDPWHWCANYSKTHRKLVQLVPR